MKILWINHRDPKHPQAGGAEVHLREVGKRIVNMGHEVTLISERFARCTDEDNIDGINVKRIGNMYSIHLKAPFFVRKKAKECDVVIDDIAHAVPWYSPIVTERPVIGIVHHVHQIVTPLELPFPLSVAVKEAEKTIKYFYRNIIAVSESTSYDLTNLLGVPRNRVKVIYYGVDHQVYSPEQERFEEPTILWLGRIKKYKNLDHLLMAFRLIKKELPNARLMIAGAGNYEQNIKEFARTLKLDDIVFPGMVFGESKTELLRRSWVLAMTSVIEGWGMSILEAASCMPGDEVVTMLDSVKPIKDIKVGDRLPFSTVIKTFERDYDQEIVSIKPKGLLARRLTIDHPVLTNSGWRKAGELHSGDYVAVPKIPSIMHFDLRKARFYGIYVGDGYMEHRAIILCPKDREQARDWAHLCIDVFGGAYIKAGKVRVPHSLSVKMSDIAGKDARSKRIPTEIFTATPESKKAFIQGLVESDGYIYQSQSKLRLSVTTTSRGLVDDLTLLLASLGIHVSIIVRRRGKSKILGREVTLNDCYVLTIFGNDAARLADISRNFKKVCRRGYVDDLYVYYKVEEVNRRPFKGRVYNFQTSDGVYGLPFLVHNCGTPSVGYEAGAVKEAIVDGKTGFLVRYGCIEELANKLHSILASEELRNRLSKGALEYSYEFDWEKTTAETLKTLKDASVTNYFS